MISIIENPKKSTNRKPLRLLELITDFTAVTIYKINIQKSIVFLYPNNERVNTKTNNTR